MTENPFDRMPKANLDADPRRKRRAMTPVELAQLMDAAKACGECERSRKSAKQSAAAAYPARPPTPGIRGEAARGRSTAGRADPTDGIGVTEDRNAPAAGSASFGASLAPGGAAGRAGPVAAARIRAHGFRGAAAGTSR